MQSDVTNIPHLFLRNRAWQVLYDTDPQMAADLPRCKAEFARRAASRPRTAFLDYLVEGPISHDAESFMDTQHFRLSVARIIEANIAEVLNKNK